MAKQNSQNCNTLEMQSHQGVKSCIQNNSIQKFKILNQTAVTQMSPIHSHTNSEKPFLLRPLDLSNIKIQKAAFGTKAKRQLTEMNSKSYCSMLTYSNVHFSNENQNKQKLNQYSDKGRPFISSTNRFNQKNQKLPGPGNYQSKNQFDKYLFNNSNKSLPILCPIKKYPVQIKINKKNQNYFQNYSQKCQFDYQNITKNSNEIDRFYIRQKVKQKFKQQKQKLLQLRKLCKHQKKTNFKPILRKKIPANKEKQCQYYQNQKTFQKDQGKSGNLKEKLNLKQITNKYLPKTQYRFEQKRWLQKQTSYARKFCYDPVFIQSNDKPFQSYITVNQNPGPGTYQIRKYQK